ncbi:hypothetical protein [Burkholderia guangdongensis]|uniref:hypothetical protein n=1 Tax=Burkholderia guangdongensis TaxID=1792500 RepID=UPI001C534E33|nr:hypothetical protein [Burkholderia guangdongensis]
MTRFTCSISLAIGASSWAALREGEAVDDMIMTLGDAADYKANPPRTGPPRAPRARFLAIRTTPAGGNRQSALTAELTLCIITPFPCVVRGEIDPE